MLCINNDLFYVSEPSCLKHLGTSMQSDHGVHFLPVDHTRISRYGDILGPVVQNNNVVNVSLTLQSLNKAYTLIFLL